MVLNDRELSCAYAKASGMEEGAALDYLKERGYKMGVATYYRTLKRVGAETLKKLVDIAKHQKERHLNRIEKLEAIEVEMWAMAKLEKDPIRKTRILKEIREHQVYLSAFDQGTKGVIAEVLKTFGKESG